MNRTPIRLVPLALLLSFTPAAAADDDARRLAAAIDRHLETARTAAKTLPTNPADDAEFMRRVYLDLAGKIPPVSEARAFLGDATPDKRRLLVERLLAGPGYVRHFTNVWRAFLVAEANTNLQLRFLLPSFEAWLRQRVADNLGYDQLIRELLTVPFTSDTQRMRDRYEQGDASPLAFYVAKEAKPETLGAATARLFLGLRLECAQCHDHPFASWKREQFWSYSAFFAGFQRRNSDNPLASIREITGNYELTIPGKEQVVPAAFLDGGKPAFQYKVSGRVTLVDWMAAAENPYFARAGANRLWAHFFGVGLVEPVDDFGDDHPPSHPALLEELAKEFTAHKFDVQFLIRAFTATRAYQLSSGMTRTSQQDPRLFARMNLKALTPEQLFDSVAEAVGYRGPVHEVPLRFGEFERSGPRAEFLTKFANQEARSEPQTTILQALYLMNGQFLSGATSLEGSKTLGAVAEAPFLDRAGKIEALFLATLSRKPRPDELHRLTKYVREKDQTGLTDIMWALLNSAEFGMNH